MALHRFTSLRRVASTLLSWGTIFLFAAGCSHEEKVLDVEAPGMELEVNQNTETGELSVKGELGEE